MLNSAPSTMERHFNCAGIHAAVDVMWRSRLVPIQRSTVLWLSGLCFRHLVDPVQPTIWTACSSHWKELTRIAMVLYRMYCASSTRLKYWSWLVLATVPNPRFGSGSGLEPNLNRCNGFYHIKKPNRTEPTVFWLVPQIRQLPTLAPIKYLSSDHITIWYIRKRCSFACSFTSSSSICDPINIRWVAAKKRRKLGVFRSDATNIDWIAKWRIGGGRACKTASLTYISYCDMIRTQILNWSPSSEFAKMRLCCR